MLSRPRSSKERRTSSFFGWNVNEKFKGYNKIVLIPNDFPKRGDLPFYASHSTEFWTFFDSELSSPWLFHLSGLYLCKVGSGKDSTKCNLQCNAKALPCSSPMRINGVSNPDPATPSYMRGSASASCLPTPAQFKLVVRCSSSEVDALANKISLYTKASQPREKTCIVGTISSSRWLWT